MVPGGADEDHGGLDIRFLLLAEVPDEVLSLTRPGSTSMMKQWVSEARYDDAEGFAWLAYHGGALVGWAAVLDGELSIYVKPSERRKGIGGQIMLRIGHLRSLRAKPHDTNGEKFFKKHGVSIS